MKIEHPDGLFPVVSPSRMRKRVTTLAFAALLLALAAGFFFTRSGPHPAEAGGAGAVAAPRVLEFAVADVTTVQSLELSETLPFTGTLMPVKRTIVRAQVAGQIKAVLAREGDTVIEGSTLARIDTTELLARLAERSANLEAARSQLAATQRTRSSSAKLVDEGFISQNSFANSQNQYEMHAADVRAQNAQVAIARNMLQDAVVRAPMAGIVAAQFAQAGERVSVDGKLFELADLTELEIEAAVPAEEIPRLQIGDVVRFAVEGFDGRTFEGRIERINPMTQAGSRSIAVHARIMNADGALKGGMFAQGEIELGAARRALAIPAVAVRMDNGATYVWRIDHGVLERQAVTLGAKYYKHGMVEVQSGLTQGTQIVAASLNGLEVGARATVTADGPPGKR